MMGPGPPQWVLANLPGPGQLKDHPGDFQTPISSEEGLSCRQKSHGSKFMYRDPGRPCPSSLHSQLIRTLFEVHYWSIIAFFTINKAARRQSPAQGPAQQGPRKGQLCTQQRDARAGSLSGSRGAVKKVGLDSRETARQKCQTLQAEWAHSAPGRDRDENGTTALQAPHSSRALCCLLL